MAHKEVDDPLVFVTSLTDTYGPKLQAALRSCVKLCGPVNQGFDLVDLLCVGVSRVEDVMTDLKTELGSHIKDMPDLGCELHNFGAAVDTIIAAYTETAGLLSRTLASLEEAKADLARAADHDRLLKETNTKLATAEKRIEAYHSDRSRVLDMFKLQGSQRRQRLANIVGAHLAADQSNLTAVSGMRDRYDTTMNSIVNQVNNLTLVVNPQATITQTFVDTAAEQKHTEEALQSAAKAFRKAYIDRAALDTAFNDRQRLSEQLDSATSEIKNSRAQHTAQLQELEVLRRTSKHQEEKIGLLTSTVEEFENAHLHEANHSKNLFGARSSHGTLLTGTRTSPIDVDGDTTRHKLSAKSTFDLVRTPASGLDGTQQDGNQEGRNTSPTKAHSASTGKKSASNGTAGDMNADGGPGNDTNLDTQPKVGTNSSTDSDLDSASKGPAGDTDANGDPDDETNLQAQPKAGTNTGTNSNSSKKRKSTASTKKTTAKRTKAGTPRTTAENEELISFLSSHEHCSRITTLDGTTIPEAIQVILAETIKEWDDHDKKFSWDTYSSRFAERCVRSHIHNSKSKSWNTVNDPSRDFACSSCVKSCQPCVRIDGTKADFDTRDMYLLKLKGTDGLTLYLTISLSRVPMSLSQGIFRLQDCGSKDCLRWIIDKIGLVYLV